MEVKNQKLKDLYSRLLHNLEWYVYLCFGVLASMKLTVQA